MLDKYDHNLLLGYLEEELSPAETARVEAMLGEDPKLSRLVASMKADRAALRGLPADAVPAAIMEQVNLRLERQMLLDEPIPFEETVRTHKTFRLHRALIYSGLAALVLISAGVVVQTLLPGGFGGVPLALPGTTAGRDGAMAMRERSSAPAREEDAVREEDVADRADRGDVAMKGGRLRGEPSGALQLPADLVPEAEEVAQAPAEPRAREMMMSKVGPVTSSPSPAPAAAGTPAPTADVPPDSPRYFARLVPADHDDPIAAAGAGQVALRRALAEAGGTPPPPAPVALLVNTDDAAQTREQVLAWARDNRAQVILPDGGEPVAVEAVAQARVQAKDDHGDAAIAGADEPEPADAAMQPRMADRAAPAEAQPEALPRAEESLAPATDSVAPPQQVLVVVSGRQIPQLLADLNTRELQLADVVSNDVAMWTPAPARSLAEAPPSGVTMPPPTPAPVRPAELGIVASKSAAPAMPAARVAIELSNGWGRLLQQQLPLSPRTAVLGADDAMVLPVQINVDPMLLKSRRD